MINKKQIAQAIPKAEDKHTTSKTNAPLRRWKATSGPVSFLARMECQDSGIVFDGDRTDDLQWREVPNTSWRFATAGPPPLVGKAMAMLQKLGMCGYIEVAVSHASLAPIHQ